IPADMVRVVMQSALSGGKSVRRPWLGASLQAVTVDIAEGLDLARPVGALVQSVRSASPAEKGGLRTGDLITAIAGQEVDDPDAFGYRFATRPLGGTVEVAIIRQGKPVTLANARQPLALFRLDRGQPVAGRGGGDAHGGGGQGRGGHRYRRGLAG
ncbi:MAG: Do family serine endopeptidase, partial [Xanthobacteraceae bacterium]|nr:Do family serine endopeptidase [Xanthobacteraceae bacterium]